MNHTELLRHKIRNLSLAEKRRLASRLDDSMVPFIATALDMPEDKLRARVAELKEQSKFDSGLAAVIPEGTEV